MVDIMVFATIRFLPLCVRVCNIQFSAILLNGFQQFKSSVTPSTRAFTIERCLPLNDGVLNMYLVQVGICIKARPRLSHQLHKQRVSAKLLFVFKLVFRGIFQSFSPDFQFSRGLYTNSYIVFYRRGWKIRLYNVQSQSEYTVHLMLAMKSSPLMRYSSLRVCGCNPSARLRKAFGDSLHTRISRFLKLL